MTTRDAALALAAFGVKVHPVSPETKAPLTKHGHLDGTTSPAAINAWWGMWPDAWPGMNLAASGLVTVAPDSPDHLAAFEQRGLDTPAKWSSPGGPGHVHHLFRRPAGCPTTRICRSGEYDIMSDGYSIAYLDDAGSVPNMNGELPDAPAWVVAMLKEAAAGKARKTEPARPAATNDEPPIRLQDPHDYEVWQGKHPKHNEDGSVGRGRTLLKIARVLYDHDMTRRGIIAELKDTDHRRLGYHKFCCRTDGGSAGYTDIVNELEANGRTVYYDLDDGSTGTQNGTSAAQKALERLELTRAREESVMRNPHRRVKAVARTAIVLARAWDGAMRGEATKTNDGGVFVWLEDEIAVDAGVTKWTASRHLKRLEEWGLLTSRFAFRVKPSTGEIVRGKAIYFPNDAPAFLDTLATFLPPPAEPREHRHCHPETRASEPELRDQQLNVPLSTAQTTVEIYGCRSRNSGSKDPRDGFTTCALCKQVSRAEVCEDCERAIGQTAEVEPTWAVTGRMFYEALTKEHTP